MPLAVSVAVVESFRVKNFKSLADSGAIELPALTLLMGANSAGKSSLIQTLLLLRQTLASRDKESVLSANVPGGLELGSYRDFITNHETQRQLEVELTTVVTSALLNRFVFTSRRRMEPGSGRIQVTFRQASRNRVALGCLETFFNNELVFRAAAPPGKSALKLYAAPESPDGAFQPLEPIAGASRLWRRNFLADPISIMGRGGLRHWGRFGGAIFTANAVNNAVEQGLMDLIHLAPLREPPKRFYLAAGETPADVGLQGELAPQVLYLSSEGSKRAEVLQGARKWLHEFGLALDLHVARIGTSHYELQVTNPESGVIVNLTDVGFGVSQILPVLVLGFFAPPGKTILLEQPEIHLHPKVQAILADMFIDITGKGRRLVVETHSEHILIRLQRRVAEGVIPATDVAVYFVDSTSSGSSVRRIDMTSVGELVGWPDGFFEGGFREALEYARAVEDARAAGDRD